MTTPPAATVPSCVLPNANERSGRPSDARPSFVPDVVVPEQPWRRAFLPLYRAMNWPDAAAYQHAERRFMLDRVLSALPTEAVRTVAEMGCGDGWVAGELAKKFPRVVGFDLNPYRIGRPRSDRVTLIAGEGERPPLADGSVDLLFSFAVFEHLPDRPAVLRELTRVVRPGGWMVHVVPTATMKALQWLGFVPDKLRHELRGLSRAVAGQRQPRGPGKFHTGMETNNPRRKSRRSWHQKLLPRVHGEYGGNLRETLDNRVSHWRGLFTSTGLRCERVVPLGLWSPYFFGGAPLAKGATRLGVSSVSAFILRAPGNDTDAATDLP